jgi:hypothetical protein
MYHPYNPNLYTYISLYISQIYPERIYHRWLFIYDPTPEDIWEDIDQHYRYVEWVVQEMKIERIEQWYKVRLQDLENRSGSLLMESKYNGLVNKLLVRLYPEIQWQPWRFEKVVHGYWNDKENVSRYLEWFRGQVGAISDRDIYDITHDEIISLHGTSLLWKWGGVFQFISHCYGDRIQLDPDSWKKKGEISKGQKR